MSEPGEAPSPARTATNALGSARSVAQRAGAGATGFAHQLADQLLQPIPTTTKLPGADIAKSVLSKMANAGKRRRSERAEPDQGPDYHDRSRLTDQRQEPQQTSRHR